MSILVGSLPSKIHDNFKELIGLDKERDYYICSCFMSPYIRFVYCEYVIKTSDLCFVDVGCFYKPEKELVNAIDQIPGTYEYEAKASEKYEAMILIKTSNETTSVKKYLEDFERWGKSFLSIVPSKKYDDYKKKNGLEQLKTEGKNMDRLINLLSSFHVPFSVNENEEKKV